MADGSKHDGGSSGKDGTKPGGATSTGEKSGQGTLPVMRSPDVFQRNFAIAIDKGTQALARLLNEKTQRSGPYSMSSEVAEASKSLSEVMEKWMAEPDKLQAAQTRLASDFIELWGRTYQRFLGQQVDPVVKPEPGDNRFRDAEWTDNPLFDFMKQAYLLTSNWAEDLVENTEGLEARKKRRAQFYIEQITTALSPSNFPFTNPEVIRTTLSSNAGNLAAGMGKLLEDLERSGDLLKIRQTDMSAFAVGRNLATTPGKVVFQNDLFQLIQYSPTTSSVHELPLMIVPPWINKFYILDLVPEKSFVKWLVDQGFTVFMVSWVNPGPELSQRDFEDYMRDGILAASDVVRQISGTGQINVLGYCVGGTLLSTALAYNAAKGDDRFASASFLAAQADFSEAGDLLMFIDDDQLAAIETLMSERGYLDGSRMASVFNMLRPRDLIWPYVVNNYLLGKEPFPFDLLYWNSDSTRMARANHSFYLREFYQHNKLAAGMLEMGGFKLDLSKVSLPVYHLATREDHIAPPGSVFRSARLLGGPVRFVLAGSGHIAGVVNPPEKHKYMHWVTDEYAFGSAGALDEWMQAAAEHAGSWWPDYAQWLKSQSGAHVQAREPGTGAFPALEDAPGSYVKA